MQLPPRVRAVDLPGDDRTLTFELNESDDRNISEQIALRGSWEPLETEIVLRLMEPPKA